QPKAHGVSCLVQHQAGALGIQKQIVAHAVSAIIESKPITRGVQKRVRLYRGLTFLKQPLKLKSENLRQPCIIGAPT
ncbi:MAG: hypothetical protein KGJ13_07485, partial [Patescibacteria group bacterium]|nr:hypothetical protein [Patescibacteria group bacterium]